MASVRFFLPVPPIPRPRIFPVFLPFAGCPHRCLFCAQTVQSGSAPRSVPEILETLDAEAARRLAADVREPVELAFYGGTFTALPAAEQFACLERARFWKAQGLADRVRCSTRPDALDAAHLKRLRAAGLDRVEVGVQSFNEAALSASGRGHGAAAVSAGCAAVRKAGLELGIQLLPGMPGVDRAVFADDVRRALELRPESLRFYPCLVIRGTALAERWRRGLYTPWTPEATVSALGAALCAAWEADVPVIRLSLAPEPELEAAVLAGPRHPALGGLVRSEALFSLIAARAAALGVPDGTPLSGLRLRLPRFCRGFFFGHRGSLRERWRGLGIDPDAVTWHDRGGEGELSTLL